MDDALAMKPILLGDNGLDDSREKHAFFHYDKVVFNYVRGIYGASVCISDFLCLNYAVSGW